MSTADTNLAKFDAVAGAAAYLETYDFMYHGLPPCFRPYRLKCCALWHAFKAQQSLRALG